MENQLVKAKDYGLEENKAIEIESKFAPMIAEKEALLSIYNDIITSELTPGLCAKAKDLRNKLVKVRTGIAKIHKTQKAFYLAGGRFVDAWKNANTEPVTQMEEKLSEIEKHFENIEKQRIEDLRISREKELFPLLDEYTPMTEGLGDMTDDMWEAYYTGKKSVFDKRVEDERLAEEARVDNERLDEIEKTRQNTALVYKDLWEESEYDFRDMCTDEFNAKLSSWKDKKSTLKAEQERIRKENERLQKEAAAIEAKNEAAKKERERLAKIEADKIEKRNEELRPYIVFIRNYNKLLKLSSEEYKKEFSDIKRGAEDHWEFERKEQIKKDKEEEIVREKREKIIRVEKQKRKRLEAELKAKEEAELKAKRDEETRKQAELNKGDAAKVKDLISELEGLKTKYSFKSAKNNKMYSDVGLLIDKVVNHIKK